MTKVSFIGCGNMASAMIGGMLGSGRLSPDQIVASAPSEETRERAQQIHGIRTTADNREAAAGADILVLAVKPQILPVVAEEIRDVLSEDVLLVSILAGVSIAQLEASFPIEPGALRKVIRLMPNTPALVGAGVTGICSNMAVTQDEFSLVCDLCGTFGQTEALPERLFDAVTALSGSGPAAVFMMIEAMAEGAVSLGLPRQQAVRMAAQTLLGSARLLQETGRHPAALKDMVTSPAGTTAELTRVLEERSFRSALIDGLRAAAERSVQLRGNGQEEKNGSGQ